MTRTIALALVAVAAAGGMTVNGEMGFDADGLLYTEVDGLVAVGLAGCVSSWETGAPSVPIAVAQLVVPRDMKVVGVRLDAFESEVIEGEFDVYPVQEPVPLSSTGTPEYVPPDPGYYGLPEYPAQVVAAGHQGSMSGYNIASVFVAPVQYAAAEKKLVFHPRVGFTVELEPAELDYAPVNRRTDEARRRIEEMLAGIVINPGDIARYRPGTE